MAKQTEVNPVPGIRLGHAASGNRGWDDLALIEIAADSNIAAVFTKNEFAAAPVAVARAHLQQPQRGKRYCLINAGNANAATGEQGHQDCLELCRQLAERIDCQITAILPFSTGIIGQRLPLGQLGSTLPAAVASLDDGNWEAAATAITTTDRFNKTATSQWQDAGHGTTTASGMAKGAGMICPNMATMLAFIACDSALDQEVLNHMLTAAVADSFNRICVDGDTSTNDAVVLMATGTRPTRDNSQELIENCQRHITQLCRKLAYDIVRDGEGASKVIEVHVHGAANNGECQLIARTIATSPLVKTAFFGCDPNWGRILAAIGRSGVTGLEIGKLHISINKKPMVTAGMADPGFDQDTMAREMRDCAELKLEIELGRGTASDYIVTCDLGHDYVNLNSDYSS